VIDIVTIAKPTEVAEQSSTVGHSPVRRVTAMRVGADTVPVIARAATPVSTNIKPR